MKRHIKEYFTLSALKHIALFPKIIARVKNWPEFIANYVGMNNKPMIVHFRNGMTIDANETYDVSTIAVVCIKEDYGVPKEGDVVIDIGSNIGAFSILAGRAGASVVYAYEPLYKTYEIFNNNMIQNNLHNIEIFNLGVGKKEMSTKLYLTEGSIFNNIYNKTNDFVKINIVSLDVIFKDNKIKQCDLLKIDSEGAEYDTFYNASNLTLSKIKRIRMEYHNTKDNHIDDLLYFLRDKGFYLMKQRKDSETSGIVWLMRN